MIKRKVDSHMKAIEELCFLLDRNIYLPVNQFIKSINSEGKTYDFGIRVSMFKGKIEKIIMDLK